MHPQHVRHLEQEVKGGILAAGFDAADGSWLAVAALCQLGLGKAPQPTVILEIRYERALMRHPVLSINKVFLE